MLPVLKFTTSLDLLITPEVNGGTEVQCLKYFLECFPFISTKKY